MHDMRLLTEKAKSCGTVMIWDLAHSAGAFPVDLAGCGAEFAVGCGYKYLNGGPGRASLHLCPAGSAAARSPRPCPVGWAMRRPSPRAQLSSGAGHRPPARRHAAGSLPGGTRRGAGRVRGRRHVRCSKRSIALSEDFIRRIEAECPELELLRLAILLDEAPRSRSVSPKAMRRCRR